MRGRAAREGMNAMALRKKSIILIASLFIAVSMIQANGQTAGTITLKSNRELKAVMKEEMKWSALESDNSGNDNMTADDSAASAEVTFTPPAEAVGKLPGYGNPVVAHKFGADPYALVYGDRVYLYNTNDVLEYDGQGEVKDNTYGNINKLSVISSDDLINWTDHGVIQVAGPQGAAKWATQSWAPAAAHKKINGKDQFFLYFANNASGIGVLTSDSPTGPWSDPIGKPLISRDMPAAAGVAWLFDPAVLVDEDGTGYLYYGGGVPEGKHEMPNTARVIQLGDDMVSIVGEASTIPAPFMFEDAGINKVGGVYYYTYCSNFYDGARPEGSPPAGEIAYMTSDHPMGPWTYQGSILKNPGHFFGVGGNNHHVIFPFHEEWYIAYHAQTLSKAMGVPKGYRSTHLNKVQFAEDGSITEIIADMQGVEPVKALDPFVLIDAATMAWSAGVLTQPMDSEPAEGKAAKLIVSDIHDGDWTAVAQADFGTGASSLSAWVASDEAGSAIEVRLDGPNGKLIGLLEVPNTNGQWQEIKSGAAGADGKHDLYFIFRGEREKELFRLSAWQFSR
ncbi:glycoside hydrolase family 43 protein [Paenibacillus soyae]|uniref:Glycoside hydrolase family 43 protein n=1 Tax=Paenibacillus soyae TaxID=2969249 RepID=A0A9X2SAM1_9BACL|nr:glycoside hydrolase family 43 protein [Paenibacillus soyae]MCR2806854.1 glycoside hydrolase family 43 protein [Paenibacillus soyae]